MAQRREKWRSVLSWMVAAALARAPVLLAETDCDPLPPAPTAAYSVTCSAFDCAFTLTSSLPPGGPARLEWDFGDGATASGSKAGGCTADACRTYANPGFYLTRLTLIAADGEVAEASKGINVGTTCCADPGALASPDAFTADLGTSLKISIDELLANDAPGVVFDQILPTPPTNAYKCTPPSGASGCTYTPPALPAGTFEGTDSFTYRVKAGDTNSDVATVTITIRRPLVAAADQFSTGIAAPILINSSQLLQNDSPGAVFAGVENPQHGTIEFVQNNQSGAVYRFTPASGYGGIASFEYLISWDGSPPFERGFVSIEVVDAPPTAAFLASCVNRTCTVNSAASDDLGFTHFGWNWGDGTPTLELTPEEQWANAPVHTYAAAGRYVITQTVTDTGGHTASDAREVLANTKPTATNDTATTDRDVPITISILGNDSDPDGEALHIVSTDVSERYPGASWTVVQQGAGWALKVTPPDSFVGTMTFGYVNADYWGATASANVTLTVRQWTSITDALGEQYYVPQNGSLRLSVSLLLGNDYDSDGDPLSIVAMDTSLLAGTLDCTSEPGICTFRTPLNSYGATSFKYTVSDPVGHRDTATVRIYVGVHGTGPTAADDWLTTVRNTPKAFTIQNLVGNDVDPDGDTLTINLTSGAKGYGTLACSNPMYACTYTPAAGYVGSDHFFYTATDVLNPGVTAYVNVLTLPPATPTFDAREDAFITAKNQQVYFQKSQLTANDYDPEGDPLTVSAIDTAGLLGSLNCDATSCTFVPGFNYTGRTTFRYTAIDGHGSSETVTVRIAVGMTNNTPVAAVDTLSTPKNTPLRFSVFELLRNDYDPDNDPLTVTVYPSTAKKGTLVCGTPNYWCTYTPAANVTGTDTITYLLSDGYMAVSSFKVNITP